MENRIEELERQIQKSIEERARLICEAASRDPETGGIPDGFLPVDCLETQDARIVYQGVEGAYSHQALRKYFGKEAQAFSVHSFEAAASAVESGLADFGVLPVENTTGGSVGDVLDLQVKYGIKTVAELDIPIRHVLLGLPEAELSGIRTVYSHPQGLLQCSEFLEGHPDWNRVPFSNTAASAKKLVADGLADQAAIASELCGELYGLKILAEGIANDPGNTTRFHIVTRKHVFLRQAGKIRICFECRHETGVLYKLLSHITLQGLNMTKIESRPLPGRNFEYRFFIELEGSLLDPNVKYALSGIRREASRFFLLGNYV